MTPAVFLSAVAHRHGIKPSRCKMMDSLQSRLAEAWRLIACTIFMLKNSQIGEFKIAPTTARLCRQVVSQSVV
jgi:hypothetical protein